MRHFYENIGDPVMYRYALLKILLFLTCFSGARKIQAQTDAGDSLSLTTCIQTAWKNNYNSQQSNLASQMAQVDYKESRQNLIPTLGLGVGHNLSQGRRIDLVTNQYINQNFSSGNQFLNASVTLFRGFDVLNRIRQQASAVKATEFEEQSARDQVMLDVILAYIQVLTARDILAQTEKRIDLTRQQLKRTSDLHNSGAISPSDYYDLKGQLAGDLNALNAVNRTYMDTRIALARVMNIPAEDLKPIEAIDFDVPAELRSKQQIYESASLWLPALKAAEWRIAEARDGIRVARSGHSPRLTMGGGFESTYSSNSGQGYFEQAKNNLGRYLSFGLAIPLTDHIFVRNNVSRARINLQDAEFRAQTTGNEWQRVVSQTFSNLDLAAENYQNLIEREENFQESFRIATSRFEAGDLNSVLFLTAKNNVEQARADKIIGQYEWKLQQFIFNYYNGQLPWQSGKE